MRVDPKGGGSDIEARIAAWAAVREDVRAAFLVGSRADPTAEVDVLSDHDVLLFVREGSGLEEDDGWVRDFGPVLVMIAERYELSGRTVPTRLVQYRDGSRIDFSLVPAGLLRRIADRPSLPGVFGVGYRVLADRDGWAARLPPPAEGVHVPDRPSEEQFLRLVDEFWWESVYVAKYLAREDLLRARYSAECVLRFRCLVPMLAWYAECEHGWAEPLGPHGGGVATLLGADDRRRLADTFGRAGAEAGWEALFAAAEWFGGLARWVAAELGYPYPEETERGVTELLERIRAGAS